MYAPITGRYLSMDPPTTNGIEVLFPNPFEYARNNPANIIQPSGDRFSTQSPFYATTTSINNAADLAAMDALNVDIDWWLVCTSVPGRVIWYGNYCGPSIGNTNLPPTDGLDKCCKIHDDCYSTQKANWYCACPGFGTKETRACDRAICACARAFNCSTLQNKKDRERCEAFKKRLIALFCYLTSSK